MKKINCILSFFFGLIYSCFPNGGPVDEAFVQKTGHICLIEKGDIQILSEKMNIKIEDNYCIIDVIYTFLNKGDSDFLHFGFPVDFFAMDYNLDIEKEGDKIRNATKLSWQDDYVEYFRMSDENGDLKITNKIDDSTFMDSAGSGEGQEFVYETDNVICARKWYLSFIYFGHNKEKTIHVKYKVKSFYSDASYSKSFFYEYSDRSLNYDFSPASHWGNGQANNFSLLIDASYVEKNKGKVFFKGIEKFKQKNGIYTFESKNMDFNKSPRLIVNYSIENLMKSRFIWKNLIPESMIKSLNVSSELKGGYSKKNLFDKDFNSAWADGVSGKGDSAWIELTFDRRKISFGVIGFINGNTKSKDDYYDNGRIKKLRYEFEFIGWDTNVVVESEEVELMDIKYENFNKYAFSDFMTELIQHGDDLLIPKRLRIISLETYPGRKNMGVAISEIFIIGNSYEYDDE